MAKIWIFLISFLLVPLFSFADPISDLSKNSVITKQQLVAEVLKQPGHPNFPWVSALAGRMVQLSGASGTILSINQNGTALIATAFHVAQVGDLEGRVFPEKLWTEAYTSLQARSGLEALKGNLRNSVVAPLYMPEVPYDQVRKGFAKLEPKNDFVLALMSGRAHSPGDNDHTLGQIPVEANDPIGLLKNSKNILSTAEIDKKIILLGFPGENQGQFSYSIGKVLSAEDAVNKISSGKDLQEKGVPFDAATEFMVDTKATPGMSGGAAFDGNGRFLGVISRGNSDDGGYVRIVRSTYLMEKFSTALRALPSDLRETVETNFRPEILEQSTIIRASCRELFK